MEAMSEKVVSVRLGMETSSHVRPSSRVSFTRPLLSPTQITPRRTGEADIDSIAPRRGSGVAPGTGARVYMLSAIGVTPFGQPRSGLSERQCAPPSVVAITDWKPP